MAHAPDRPLQALNAVLDSVSSVRNGRAVFVLLGVFATAGLLLSMAQSSLARGGGAFGVLQAGLALTVAFYGANAAGLLVMDEALGRPPREVADAVRDALAGAHRLLIVMLAVAAGGLAAIGVLAGLLWLCRTDVLGPVAGPVLFGAVVPIAVVVIGTVVLAGLVVAGPLAAPATWSGLGVRDTLAFLWRQLRRRLVFAALLSGAVSLVVAAMGALVSFVVLAGGRAVAALAIVVVDVELPPQQLMAGLFGYGLRSLGAANVPVTHHAHGVAALVGGGVVFALALVLPGVVYLRGVCAAFLALRASDDARDAPTA